MNQLSDIDWLTWNDVKCTTYGMRVLTQPSIIMAKERVTSTAVPARSGSLTLLEGENIYDDIVLSCTCVIDDPYMNVTGTTESRVAKICGWLKGDGIVRFASRQEGFYEARIANQISFDQILRGNPHRAFQIHFQCKPFFRLLSGIITFNMVENPTRLVNLGNIPSAPLLKLRGTGEGTIMCGSSTMLINSFSGLDYIMLDCEAKIAYKGAKGDASDPLTLLGTRVTGEWLTIPTGTQFLSRVGGITSVEYTPRWRCL